jgi:hypothetical protein
VILQMPRLDILQRPLPALMLGVLALALGGCGGSLISNTPAPNRGAPPAIVSAKQIAGYPANTPQRSVLTIWRYGELGDDLPVVAQYHPKVRRVLGETTIAAAYDLQRSYLVDVVPTILGVDSTSQGEVVTLEETPKSGSPLIDTFVFRKVNGTWQIVYDTFLQRALQYYVQTQMDPNVSARPTQKALQAGQAEAAAYRNIFLAGPANTSSQPPIKSAGSKTTSSTLTPTPGTSTAASSTTATSSTR